MTNFTVTAAKPLTADEKEKLEKSFADTYGEFTVDYVIDDALIGGLMIFDGEKVYDGSVAGQLKRLRDKLTRK